MSTTVHDSRERHVRNSLQCLYSWDGYPTLLKLLNTFSAVEIYLVGGAVRDSILELKTAPKDFDFILDGITRSDLTRFLNDQGVLSFGQFGSPRWKFKNSSKAYCDLMLVNEWNAGLGRCNSATQILQQFDFTGNAVGIGLRDMKLIDPVGGYQDLTNRILRAIRVDFPDKPIRSDTLLTKMAIHWFRYQQYALSLGLKIEKGTRQWLNENGGLQEQEQLYSKEFGRLDCIFN